MEVQDKWDLQDANCNQDKPPSPTEDADDHFDETLKDGNTENSEIRIQNRFCITQEDFLEPLKLPEKNIIKGPFDNKEHYLRVHSDLMVEDYKAPLRKTAKLLIKHVRDKQKMATSPEAAQSIVEEVLREESHCSQSSSRRTSISVISNTEEDDENNLIDMVRNLKLEDTRTEAANKLIDSSVHIDCGVTFLYEEFVDEMYCYRIKMSTESRFDQIGRDRFWTGSGLHFTVDLENFVFGKIVKSDPGDPSELTVGFLSKPGIQYKKKYIMFEIQGFYDLYYRIVREIQNTKKLPMEKYLVDCDVSIRPPAYLSEEMSYIVANKEVRVLDSWPEISTNELNKSQLNALKAALCQEFVVIHGPPGTGKTHVAVKIIEALLMNRHVHKQIPILVVTQTNNALDNLLEKVLDLNIADTSDSILRVGSGFRKDPLELYTLKRERFNYPDWRFLPDNDHFVESSLSANILMALEAFDGIVSFEIFVKVLDEDVNHFWLCYKELMAHSSPIAIVDWLMEGANTEDFSDPVELKEAVDNVIIETDQCYQFDESGYRPLITLKKLKEDFYKLESALPEDPELLYTYYSAGGRVLYLYKKLEGGKAQMMDENVDDDLNLDFPPDDENGWAEGWAYSLDPDMRWKLYFTWKKMAIKQTQSKIDCLYKVKRLQKMKQRENVDVEIFKEKLLIGMTTSSAAIHKATLEKVKPSILIVEEASEILESHIIAALTPHCQHMILIGDHKQLRPTTQDQITGKLLGLRISLFERMINNNIQVSGLNVQHRAHPQIAALISCEYPELINHWSAQSRSKNLSEVTGPVYFLNHTNAESECWYTKSKSNEYEAWFCSYLAQHLIHMGQEPSSITIVAAYSAQVKKIGNAIDIIAHNMIMNSDTDGAKKLLEVGVTTLDGFQGEENNIILLSLVRNNLHGDIGFLNENNRINVALSRAKDKLYILGNIHMLINKSQMWCNVRDTLISQDALVSSLPLPHSDCLYPYSPTRQGITYVKKLHQVRDAHQCNCIPGLPIFHVDQNGYLCQSFIVPEPRSPTGYVCYNCNIPLWGYFYSASSSLRK